jgi:hypothetical protein
MEGDFEIRIGLIGGQREQEGANLAGSSGDDKIDVPVSEPARERSLP